MNVEWPEFEPPTRVISLVEARNRYRPGQCEHKHIEVDEALEKVKCLDCDQMLSAIALLVRYAREESRLHWRYAELRKLDTALDAKVRCKCQHCGLFTRVKP